MAQFKLGCTVGVSAYTVVYADTLEQAIELARLRDVEIGDERCGVDCKQVWAITDADGAPTDIHPES